MCCYSMSQYRVMKVNVRGPKTVGLKTRENELNAGTVTKKSSCRDSV